MSSSRREAERNINAILHEIQDDEGGVMMSSLEEEATITTVMKSETSKTIGFEVTDSIARKLKNKLGVGMYKELPFKVYDLKTDKKHDVKLILNSRNRYIIDWRNVGSSLGQKIRFDFHYDNDDRRIGLFFAQTRY